MAFLGGHQLAKTLAQNFWKVLGAFGLGIVAVVGGGLILSDVHRIPQGTRSSKTAISKPAAKPESVLQNAPKGDGQSVQNNVPAEPPPVQVPDEGAPGDQVAGRNNPPRSFRRKSPPASTVVNIPNQRDAADNRQSLANPPLPAAPLIPQSVPVQLARGPDGGPLMPSSADSALTLQPETPITVRLTDELSTKKNRTGEVFRGTLAGPLKAKGIVVAEAGAPVLGRIVEARSARLFRGGSNLNLELTDVQTIEGRLVKVKTTQWYDTGSHSKVVKAAMLPGEAAKKVASGMKEGDNVSSPPERTVAAEPADTTDKTERKGAAVTLPSGSEIAFKLLESLSVSGNADHR